MVRLYAHDVGAVDFIDRAAKATFAASSLGKAKRIAEHRRALFKFQLRDLKDVPAALTGNRRRPWPSARSTRHFDAVWRATAISLRAGRRKLLLVWEEN
jgi:hypothetical protein